MKVISEKIRWGLLLIALLLLSSVIPVATAAGIYTFTAKWDVSGQPSDVALDSVGNVYVADMQNSQIKKFSSTGTLLANWGTFGIGNVQFKQPQGVAVDSAGNIYVTDYYNHRVQKLDSNGEYLTQWGGTGTANGSFATSTPMGGLAVDSAGNVYVADTNNHRIQKFSSTGTFITKWGSSGSGDGQFNQPQDVAIDSVGNVYVTDKGNNRIQKFTSGGTFLANWGSSGPGDGQFVTPWGITVDGAGNVFVVEQSFMYVGGYPGPIVGMRVQKFDSNGGFITKFGGYSGTTVDGLFSGPRKAVVDSVGTVYVADTVGSVIQKFAPPATPPVTDFTANVTNGTSPLAVGFTDQSTGSPTFWLWDFGDGNTSTVQNPVHVFNLPGAYTVSLTATNASGSNTTTKTGFITVQAPVPTTVPTTATVTPTPTATMPALVVNFTANVTTGPSPLTVQFKESTTGLVRYFFWQFGDGSISLDRNPVHRYNAVGSYTVSLFVIGSKGVQVKTIRHYITVTPPLTPTPTVTVKPTTTVTVQPTPGAASFIVKPTSGERPLTVALADTTTGGHPVSWKWNCGNGQSFTGKSVGLNKIWYYRAGTYTITLTVTDANRSTRTASKTITVTN